MLPGPALHWRKIRSGRSWTPSGHWRGSPNTGSVVCKTCRSAISMALRGTPWISVPGESRRPGRLAQADGRGSEGDRQFQSVDFLSAAFNDVRAPAAARRTPRRPGRDAVGIDLVTDPGSPSQRPTVPRGRKRPHIRSPRNRRGRESGSSCAGFRLPGTNTERRTCLTVPRNKLC
jgi:hypothetical protein